MSQLRIITESDLDQALSGKADKLELKSITTQPSTHVVGDLYYNSTTNLIYEYKRHNGSIYSWGSGATPELGVIYVFDVANYMFHAGQGLIEIKESAAPIPSNVLSYDSDAGTIDLGTIDYVTSLGGNTLNLYSDNDLLIGSGFQNADDLIDEYTYATYSRISSS